MQSGPYHHPQRSDSGGNSSQQSSSYKVCTGGARNMSETDANVEDAPSERGAKLITKTHTATAGTEQCADCMDVGCSFGGD
jgi:hypothetical protein